MLLIGLILFLFNAALVIGVLVLVGWLLYWPLQWLLQGFAYALFILIYPFYWPFHHWIFEPRRQRKYDESLAALRHTQAKREADRLARQQQQKQRDDLQAKVNAWEAKNRITGPEWWESPAR